MFPAHEAIIGDMRGGIGDNPVGAKFGASREANTDSSPSVAFLLDEYFFDLRR
jgi:hypothetical protein